MGSHKAENVELEKLDSTGERIMYRSFLCLQTIIISTALCASPLHAEKCASEYSDEHIAAFNQANDYKKLFSKDNHTELQPFVDDLEAIMKALKKGIPTETRLRLISRQLTRYEKVAAVLKEKPFDRFRYRLLCKMLKRHAALYEQYRGLLHDRQIQRHARPPRGATFQELDTHQTKLKEFTRKISAVHERMGELDRTLLADNRSFVEKHRNTVVMSTIAAASILYLWVHGYLGGWFEKRSEDTGNGSDGHGSGSSNDTIPTRWSHRAKTALVPQQLSSDAQAIVTEIRSFSKESIRDPRTVEESFLLRINALKLPEQKYVREVYDRKKESLGFSATPRRSPGMSHPNYPDVILLSEKRDFSRDTLTTETGTVLPVTMFLSDEEQRSSLSKGRLISLAKERLTALAGLGEIEQTQNARILEGADSKMRDNTLNFLASSPLSVANSAAHRDSLEHYPKYDDAYFEEKRAEGLPNAPHGDDAEHPDTGETKE